MWKSKEKVVHGGLSVGGSGVRAAALLLREACAAACKKHRAAVVEAVQRCCACPRAQL